MRSAADHQPDDVVAVAGEAGVALTAPSSAHASTLSVLLLVISSLIFSTGGLFVRSLDQPHAWTTVFWRSVAAAISLCILLAWKERSNTVRAITQVGRPGYTVAAAFAASSICMVVALSRTSVAVVLVIFALSPLAAAVLAWLLIGERVRGFTWAAIAVTVAGVGFMVSGPDASASPVGVIVALVIPLAFGYGTVVIRRHSDIEMLPAMLLAAVISGVVALPFAHPLQVNRHDLLLLLAFGSCQLGVGLAIFSVGAARTPATEVALLAMLEPIAGPIWVWAFRSEYPGVSALIGGAVVFVALAVHTLYAAARTR